jgi:hypothetical protein
LIQTYKGARISIRKLFVVYNSENLWVLDGQRKLLQLEDGNALTVPLTLHDILTNI